MSRRINEIANHAEESEKSLEKYLVRQINIFGGKALKYSNPYETGYPDRLVIIPFHAAVWCELKSKGKKPRPIQELRHKELRELGQVVYVCDSKLDIDMMIDTIMA